MAGFNEEMSYEVLNISKDNYRVMAAIAVGYLDEAAQLPTELAEKEMPSNRKSLSEIAKNISVL